MAHARIPPDAASIPTSASAIVISGAGGPEVLALQERPVDAPERGEVLIKVAAAGVNRHDCNQRRLGPGHEKNPVPGLEVAGTVVAIGADVSRDLLGADVVALTDGGGYAEYAIAPAALVLPWPASFSRLEAAGLPEALFTAWFNFFHLLALKPGETAFIHGATSGVGSLAIQMLRALGFAVYGSAGSDAKRRAAQEFGAAAAFDYADPHLARDVLAATGGRGVDAILDMSAGAHLAQDLAMLAPGGRISHLSAGGGREIAVPLRALMAKRISITGALLRPLPLGHKTLVSQELARDVWPLLGEQIRPVIASVHPLRDATEAHRAIERGAHVGKVVLDVVDRQS